MNAAQAMDNKGILKISLTESHINNEVKCINGNIKTGFYSLLCVEDTGCGSGKDILDKIFEPFFTTKEVNQGR